MHSLCFQHCMWALCCTGLVSGLSCTQVESHSLLLGMGIDSMFAVSHTICWGFWDIICGSNDENCFKFELCFKSKWSKYRSFLEFLLFSTPSHLIHCPCLAWATAFMYIVSCSFWCTSSTRRLRSSLPDSTWPTMYLCWCVTFACWVASASFDTPLGDKVAKAVAVSSSQVSVSIISSLTLVHLCSSSRLERFSC